MAGSSAVIALPAIFSPLLLLLRKCFCAFFFKAQKPLLNLDLNLKPIQARMTQKPLLWVEVGKSVCVFVGICGLRLSPPARYDPQYPSLLDFLSGCLVRVLWTCRSSTDPARDVEQITPYHRAFLFLIKTTVTIATRVLSCGRIVNLFPGLCSSMAQPVYWVLP